MHGAKLLPYCINSDALCVKELMACLQARYWMVLQEGDPLVGMGPRLQAEAYQPATLQLAGEEGFPVLATGPPALQPAATTSGLSPAVLQQDGPAAEQSTAPAWQPAAGAAEVAQLPGAHEAANGPQAAPQGLGALASLITQQQEAPSRVSTQPLPSTSLPGQASDPAGGGSQARQAPGSQQGPGSAASCRAASAWRTGAGFKLAGEFAAITILDVMPLRLSDSIQGNLSRLPQVCRAQCL